MEVEERVVTSFRSYSVTCHFHLRGETGLQQPIHIQAKNTDILGRGDTRFSAKTSNDDSRRLMAVLDCYPEITDALDCLNFRRLNLRSEAGQWQLEIELFAATELVGPRLSTLTLRAASSDVGRDADVPKTDGSRDGARCGGLIPLYPNLRLIYDPNIE